MAFSMWWHQLCVSFVWHKEIQAKQYFISNIQSKQHPVVALMHRYQNLYLNFNANLQLKIQTAHGLVKNIVHFSILHLHQQSPQGTVLFIAA